LSTGKPWAMLVPNYVANKQYFREAVEGAKGTLLYLVPGNKYEFAHPEGTGHETSPFFSLWFVFLPEADAGVLGRLQKWRARQASCGWELKGSIQELQVAKAVPTAKRLSNKRRKKLKTRLLAQRACEDGA
jgi:hypothetical protein